MEHTRLAWPQTAFISTVWNTAAAQSLATLRTHGGSSTLTLKSLSLSLLLSVLSSFCRRCRHRGRRVNPWWVVDLDTNMRVEFVLLTFRKWQCTHLYSPNNGSHNNHTNGTKHKLVHTSRRHYKIMKASKVVGLVSAYYAAARLAIRTRPKHCTTIKGMSNDR